MHDPDTTAASAADGRTVLDADAIRRTLLRMAHEIVEHDPDAGQLCLIGIYTRGVVIAHRLAAAIETITGEAPSVGAVDISFHRDDIGARRPDAEPIVHATRLDFNLDGRTVVLCDDVLYTGRTVRAAIDAVLEYGRPAQIRLAVVADRGHRELPIRADVRRKEPADGTGRTPPAPSQ